MMQSRCVAIFSVLVWVGCGGGGPPAADNGLPPEDNGSDQVTPDQVTPDQVTPDGVTSDVGDTITTGDSTEDQITPDGAPGDATPDQTDPDTTEDVTADADAASPDVTTDGITPPDVAMDNTTNPDDGQCTNIECAPGEVPEDTDDDGCFDNCLPDPCECQVPFGVCLENGQTVFDCAAEAECSGYCECGTVGCFGDCYNKGVCSGPDCDCTEEQLEFTVCGMDGETYENSCALMEAYDCAPEETVLLHLGPCQVNTCTCPNNDVPVCGSDGVTYTNNCHLQNCSIGSPTVACGGACQSTFFGASCLLCADLCEPVCGKNGTTYGNECLSACSEVEVEHQGSCCTCDINDVNPVCGSDAVTYTNACTLNCASILTGVTQAYVGPCQCNCTAEGPVVCAADGQTYENVCFAECAGQAVVFEGTCSSADCPCENVFTPVCGLDGVTYPSQCMAACKGAVVASAGLCPTCQSQACTTFEPYCGEDGMTYPAPEFFSFDCAKGTQVWSSKEPCSACEEDTDCNDLNPCTTDTCGADEICSFAAVDGCTDVPAWATGGTNCP